MSNNNRRPYRFLTLAIVALTIAVVAWAAPFKPMPTPVSDLTLSIAAIRRLKVSVRKLPAVLEAAGLTQASIEKEWSRRLTNAGFEVIDDDDVPILLVLIVLITDHAFPDAYSFVIYLALHQSVHVHSLDETLNLPTYSDFSMGIESRDQIEASVQFGLDGQLKKFVTQVATASAYRRKVLKR